MCLAAKKGVNGGDAVGQQGDRLRASRGARDDPGVGAAGQRYSNRIYRYALGRTRSTTIADDIVSDTMMSAMEGINGFNPDRGSFASWIFTIASRRIADRDRKSRQFWRFLARRGHHEEHDEDALTTTIRLERRDDVRRAISGLSDQHQQVVLLRYVAELPIATISEILDISEGAVKMRLQRALKRLAVELERDE